jgi:hypothetical protein
MSSLLNSYDQIQKNTQYFLSLATTTVYKVNPGVTIQTIMTPTSFSSGTTTTTYDTGTQYHYLGKYTITVDSSGKHLAKYIYVQLINGAETEGVPSNYNTTDKFYIPIWAAEPALIPIKIGRTE